jgi:lysozyme family protein
MVFDTAVNSGVATAIRLLQTAVGVHADGHFGPLTLAAVKAKSPGDTIHAFHAAHEAFYRSLETFSVFGRGWLARNDRTRDLALEMV